MPIRLTNCQILPGMYLESCVILYILKHSQNDIVVPVYFSENSIDRDKDIFPIIRTKKEKDMFDRGNEVKILIMLLKLLYT